MKSSQTKRMRCNDLNHLKDIVDTLGFDGSWRLDRFHHFFLNGEPTWIRFNHETQCVFVEGTGQSKNTLTERLSNALACYVDTHGWRCTRIDVPPSPPIVTLLDFLADR